MADGSSTQLQRVATSYSPRAALAQISLVQDKFCGFQQIKLIIQASCDKILLSKEQRNFFARAHDLGFVSTAHEKQISKLPSQRNARQLRQHSCICTMRAAFFPVRISSAGSGTQHPLAMGKI